MARPMQNSRQKKKVSQQKKRYHDRAKGKGQATAATGTKGENIAEVSNSANKTSAQVRLLTVQFNDSGITSNHCRELKVGQKKITLEQILTDMRVIL